MAWFSLNRLGRALGDSIGTDSGVFATAASHLMKGKVLYRDIWDHKPPGVYVLLCSAFYLFGESPGSILILQRIFLCGAVVAVYLLVRLEGASQGLALFASCFFLYYGSHPKLLEGGNLTEQYALTLLLFGVLALRRISANQAIGLRWSFLGGLCFGAASLLKEPFVVSSVPWIMWLGFLGGGWKEGGRRIGAFLLGALGLVTLTALFLLGQGGLKFWLDAISYNFAYVHHITPPLPLFSRLVVMPYVIGYWILKRSLLGSLMFFVGVLFGLKNIVPDRGTRLLLLGWFLADTTAACSSPSYYPHYFLQVLGSYTLLCVIGLVQAWRWGRQLLHALLPVAEHRLIGGGIFLLFFGGLDLTAWQSMVRRYQLSGCFEGDRIVREVRSLASQGDCLWTTYGALARYNFLTGLQSPVRLFYVYDHLFLDTWLSTGEQKLSALKVGLLKAPPRFIVRPTKEYLETLQKSLPPTGEIRLSEAGIVAWIEKNYRETGVRSKTAYLLEWVGSEGS
jgi:hypothetical protein